MFGPALLKTIEREQYGFPILSPSSFVEHLIAEPEVDVNKATLERLQEVCAGEEAGDDTKTYESMAEVLREGGECLCIRLKELGHDWLTTKAS